MFSHLDDDDEVNNNYQKNNNTTNFADDDDDDGDTEYTSNDVCGLADYGVSFSRGNGVVSVRGILDQAKDDNEDDRKEDDDRKFKESIHRETESIIKSQFESFFSTGGNNNNNYSNTNGYTYYRKI